MDRRQSSSEITMTPDNTNANATAMPSSYVHSHRSLYPFFTPTHLTLRPTASRPDDQPANWQSRKARKGRYATKAHHIHPHENSAGDGDSVSAKTVFLRIEGKERRMRAGLKLDVSFWEASLFTFGSMFWVINGFLVWLPDLRESLGSTVFENTAAATAFLGGTIFEIGSYLMVVEALDRGREKSRGTGFEEVLTARRKVAEDAPGHEVLGTQGEKGSEGIGKLGKEWPKGAQGQVWWGPPMWHDLGYLAAIIQLCAATVFWVSTLTGLPGVIPGLLEGSANLAIEDVFFWTPQVIGGTGFIISSTILMLEVQKKWYLPNPLDIGWQVGFWNLIGSVGFCLCGAFGYSPMSGLVYESGLSTFWGSWAFLIGSGFQMWEVIFREPDE